MQAAPFFVARKRGNFCGYRAIFGSTQQMGNVRVREDQQGPWKKLKNTMQSKKSVLETGEMLL